MNHEKSSSESGTSDSCLGDSAPSQPSLKVIESNTLINDDACLDRCQAGIIDLQTEHQEPSRANLKEESRPSDNDKINQPQTSVIDLEMSGKVHSKLQTSRIKTGRMS